MKPSVSTLGLKKAILLQCLLLFAFFGVQLLSFWLIEPLGLVISRQVVFATYLSGCLTAVLSLVIAGHWRLSLGMRAFAPMSFVYFCAGLLAFLLISQLVFEYFGSMPMEFMDKLLAGSGFWWVLILVVVIAPVYEELFFRGILFDLITHANSTLAQGQKNALALMVSSGSFALVHLQYDWLGMVSLFLMALLFGAAKLHSKSLFLPMILHAINNAVAMAVYLLERS